MMIAAAHVRAGAAPLRLFLDTLFVKAPLRVGGTAVFLTIDPDSVPHALVHNLEHNGELHERVVFVNVTTREVPWVPLEDRVKITPLGRSCFRVVVAFGFKDEVDLPLALKACEALGLPIEPMKVSYFLSHAVVVATGGQGMWLWREKLFAAMSHNMANVAEYLKLPTNRVIELGSRVEI